MRILLLSLCVMLAAVYSDAQSITDTSYSLLWYKGKRITTNSLRTPTGDSVFYNPSKGSLKVIASTGHGRTFDNMLAECNRTSQRMNNMLQKIAAVVPKPALPAYSVLIEKAYSEVKETFAPLLSNNITLPDIQLSPATTQVVKGPAQSVEEGNIFDEAVSKLEAYMAAHKDEKITWVPAPPRRSFTYCYNCDKEAQRQYKKDFETFLNEMAGNDKEILIKLLAISRQSALLQTHEEDEAVQKRLGVLLHFFMARQHDRAQLLIEKYSDDPERCYAVLQVALSADRQEQLLGLADRQFPPDYMLRAITTSANIIKKAIEEKDYSIALNIELLLATDRQFQLLGSHTPDGLLDKALAFNQFKLSINVSAKVGGNGGYQLAAAKGENWFVAIPDSGCTLQWYLVGPYVNKMKIDLTASEMRGKAAALEYVGTKNWMSDVPKMRVGFCNEPVDSVELYSFHPEAFKELWRMPPPQGVTNIAITNNVLMNCFFDITRIKKDAAKFQNPEEVEKLKAQMIAKYSQMLKTNKMNTIHNNGAINLRDLGQVAELQKSSREFSSIVQAANPGRYLFKPEVHNKATVIIDEKMNGKELFPQNEATEYAWFFLKLEHDPEGPYHLRL